MKQSILFLSLLFFTTHILHGRYSHALSVIPFTQLDLTNNSPERRRLNTISQQILSDFRRTIGSHEQRTQEAILLLQERCIQQLHNPQTLDPFTLASQSMITIQESIQSSLLVAARLKDHANNSFQLQTESTEGLIDTLTNSFHLRTRVISQEHEAQVKKNGENAIIAISAALTLLCTKR